MRSMILEFSFLAKMKTLQSFINYLFLKCNLRALQSSFLGNALLEWTGTVLIKCFLSLETICSLKYVNSLWFHRKTVVNAKCLPLDLIVPIWPYIPFVLYPILACTFFLSPDKRIVYFMRITKSGCVCHTVWQLIYKQHFMLLIRYCTGAVYLFLLTIFQYEVCRVTILQLICI